jgi:hypothetical protein
VFKAHYKEEQKGIIIKKGQKAFSMNYQCNLLTSMLEEDGVTLLSALANSTDAQLDIFNTDVVRDIIQYKWNCYAARSHWLSGVLYLGYTLVLAMYINDIYLKDEVFIDNVRQNPPPNKPLLIALGVLLLRAVQIDLTQMKVSGLEYFDDVWNFNDLINIGFGYWNISNQLFEGTLEL